MKRKSVTFLLLGILSAVTLNSQTIYEASNLLNGDINGTARYVAMGGAMNALGGDISVISSNPAGIGIYRSNDFMVSMGPNMTKTSFSGTGTKKSMFSFDNIGFVYSASLGKKSSLRFVNFGFSYKKRKNFNASYSGIWKDGYSQTNTIADMATTGVNLNEEPGYDSEQFESATAFIDDSPYVGWLPVMAYNCYLINPLFNKDGIFEGVWGGFDRQHDMYHKYDINQSGWINDYDFNLSFNIADRVYLGATLTAADVKYSKTTLYKEDFYGYTSDGRYVTDGGYDLNNYFSTSGAGIGFSLGAIVRLNSDLRIGFSFSTPTIYMLTDYQESTMTYDLDIFNEETGEYERKFASISPVDGYGDFMGYQYNYRVRTPWKLNLSLGATMFRRLAIDAEYEFMDASKSRIKYDNGDGVDVLNDGYGIDGSGISQAFKRQHTGRIGAEFRILPSLALRAGFNYTTALTDPSAFKFMESGSARTDTEYANINDRLSVSGGIGYAARIFYFDFAYQYMAYDADFYAFDSLNMPAIDLKTKRHQALFTLGFRF